MRPELSASGGARMRTISKIAAGLAIALGVGMIALGAIFMVMGFNAKSDVGEALAREQIVTSKDAPIPGVPVEDARTAKAQQDAIENHTFGRWGPFSQLKGDDPNRATYISGLTLRTALNLAVIGFGISDLAIGVGAVTIVLGLIIAGFAIPVHLVVMRLYQHPAA